MSHTPLFEMQIFYFNINIKGPLQKHILNSIDQKY